MARNYDETYLDGLIAKAKKSWEGVDADCYMKNLRDDTDKEDAVLHKEIASYITEQAKYNRLKIIEERAERYATRPLISDSTIPAYIANEQRNAYIAGAKDQQYIDRLLIEQLIDKACEWLKENIDGGVHPSSAYGFVEKFRKAMKDAYKNEG